MLIRPLLPMNRSWFELAMMAYERSPKRWLSGKSNEKQHELLQARPPDPREKKRQS
jgi:hypothetical protein